LKEFRFHDRGLDVVLDLSLSRESSQRRRQGFLDMLGDNRGELNIDLPNLDVFQSIGSIGAIVIEGKLRSNQSECRASGAVIVLL
jgi:hypothetical protein